MVFYWRMIMNNELERLQVEVVMNFDEGNKENCKNIKLG
jgi:hypothetical protein